MTSTNEHFRAVVFLKELPWRPSFKEACRDLVCTIKAEVKNSTSQQALDTTCYIEYKGGGSSKYICDFYDARDKAYYYKWMSNGEWVD